MPIKAEKCNVVPDPRPAQFVSSLLAGVFCRSASPTQNSGIDSRQDQTTIHLGFAGVILLLS